MFRFDESPPWDGVRNTGPKSASLAQCANLRINRKANHSKHSECGCGKRMLKIALWLLAKVQFPAKNSTFFCHKNAFFEKGPDQKMFGPLFLDSAYFSDAKSTFGMFGMICFVVDSQTLLATEKHF
jgi:hypothetical protein